MTQPRKTPSEGQDTGMGSPKGPGSEILVPVGLVSDPAAPPPSITCPDCGRVSYNLNDVQEGYCGYCQDWTTDVDVADLGNRFGPCCICEGTVDVWNLITLPFPAPIPGTGWGCTVCNLPADGAIAVVCDACVGESRDRAPLLPRLKFVFSGLALEKKRAPIASCQTDVLFKHDEITHALSCASDPALQ